MGLPEIIINFIKKATSVIKRSSRGMVLLILNDNTTEQAVTPYKSILNVSKQDWTAKNYDYIRMAFEGEPSSVVCVRAVITENVVDIPNTVNIFKDINFDWLAYPECTGENAALLKAFIADNRKRHKKSKAVLPNTAADSKDIVNFTMKNIVCLWNEDDEETVTYTTAEYCSRIAGILAGMPLTRSATYYVLDEIVDLEQVEEPDAAIDEGKLIIIFDGEKYKIGRGVTSLQTVSEDCPADFKKIKIVEAADIVYTDIYTTFEDEYVGKLNNTYDNKQAFIGAINNYFEKLYGTVLDGNSDNYAKISMEKNIMYLKDQGIDTDTLEEQEILEANTGATIFLEGKVKFLDAVEDLSLDLTM